jgi:hypothetical protein
MKNVLLAIFTGILLCASASAQAVKEKGIGSATYQPTKKASAASSSDKENALAKARLNAIERYFAGRGEAETENFMRMEDKINAALDRIILSDTVLNEKDESGKYTVTISVEINEARLRTLMRSESNKPRKYSDIVYLFMGREVGSIRQAGPNVTRVNSIEASSSVKGSLSTSQEVQGERTSSASNRGSLNVSQDVQGQKASAAVETKGAAQENTREAISGGTVIKGDAAGKENIRVAGSSNTAISRNEAVNASARQVSSSETVIKRDEISYKLLSMSNYDSAITSVFSQSGFSVIDPRFVIGQHLSSVNIDYTNGDDINPATLNGVVHELRTNEIPYLVLATLDVDPPTIDSATGLKNVIVRATVRVLDVSAGFPREVASVPAYQIAGRGETDSEAQNKALSESSQRAAREIVQRLNAVDVR